MLLVAYNIMGACLVLAFKGVRMRLILFSVGLVLLNVLVVFIVGIGS